MLETVTITIKTRGLECGRVYNPGQDIENVIVDVENTLRFLETEDRLNIAYEMATESGD